MSIAHVPVLEDNWKRDPVLRYAPIADCISRDRFRDISRYLHFADNSSLIPRGIPGLDCLDKVRPVLAQCKGGRKMALVCQSSAPNQPSCITNTWVEWTEVTRSEDNINAALNRTSFTNIFSTFWLILVSLTHTSFSVSLESGLITSKSTTYSLPKC